MEFQDKSLELRRLWGPLHLDRRRATVLRRQKLQKRAETLQGLQSEARRAPVGRRRHRPRARRDEHQLLGVRQGNHRAVPSDAGPPGVLPRVFPVAEVRGGRRRLTPSTSRRDRQATPRAWPSFFRDLSRQRESLSPRIQPPSCVARLHRSSILTLAAGCSRVQPRRRRGAAARPAAAADRPRQPASASSRSQDKPIELVVGVHLDRAVAELDDRPAAGGRAGHAHLRQVGRRRPRRRAAGPDRPGEAGRDAAQHRVAARRAARRTSPTGRRRSSGCSRCSRRARSARTSSTRRSTTSTTAQANLAALDAQVREGRVQLQYYRVTAPTAGVVGDIAVREGDRITTSTVITTIDDKAGLEAYIQVPVDRAPDLRLGLATQILDPDGKVVATNPITFVAPRVDPATQTVLAKSAAEGSPADRARSSSS